MRSYADDAIRETGLATAVVSENRMRDYRGRRVTLVSIDHHIDAIRRQHLQSARQSGLRKRVRIDADVERPVNALLLAVETNRLRNGENVRLVERVIERRTAMSRGSKRNALCGH